MCKTIVTVTYHQIQNCFFFAAGADPLLSSPLPTATMEYKEFTKPYTCFSLC